MAEDPIHVLFVDDDPEFLNAVRLVVGGEVNVQTAATVGEALAIKSAPDVAFIDLGLPDGDGVDLVRALTARFPILPLVVLTANKADERVLAAFRAGARGYLFKEDVGRRLSRAIVEAMEGGAPMSAQVARRVLKLVAGLPDLRAPRTLPEPLTEQELNVVRELAEGASYLQAAAGLGISINTLRSHVRNVYRKLSVGTRTEAVMAALQLGLLEHH